MVGLSFGDVVPGTRSDRSMEIDQKTEYFQNYSFNIMLTLMLYNNMKNPLASSHVTFSFGCGFVEDGRVRNV